MLVAHQQLIRSSIAIININKPIVITMHLCMFMHGDSFCYKTLSLKYQRWQQCIFLCFALPFHDILPRRCHHVNCNKYIKTTIHFQHKCYTVVHYFRKFCFSITKVTYLHCMSSTESSVSNHLLAKQLIGLEQLNPCCVISSQLQQIIIPGSQGKVHNNTSSDQVNPIKKKVTTVNNYLQLCT